MKKWEQFSFLFGIREEKFLNIFLDLFLPVKIAWLIEVSQTMDTDRQSGVCLQGFLIGTTRLL